MPRSCGSCTLCCTVTGIKEGMPDTPNGENLPNVPCPYAKAHAPSCGGCSIYETRPSECSGYACMWLEGLGGTADRPDKVGVLFEVHDQEDPTLRRRPHVEPRKGEEPEGAGHHLPPAGTWGHDHRRPPRGRTGVGHAPHC